LAANRNGTGDFALSRGRNRKAAEAHAQGPQNIRPVRDGDWMPSDEFCAAAATAANSNADVLVNLEGLEYLDASALQIILALSAEQKKRARKLSLIHASPALLRWFEYTGAVQEFVFA
jgi:hypothetical protein